METNNPLTALGFSSLEEYLKSNKMKVSFILDVVPRCEDAVLTVSAAPGDFTSCCVLLKHIPEEGSACESLVIPCRRAGDELHFDLRPCADTLLQTPGKWLCYLGQVNDREVLVYRMRAKGRPKGLMVPPKPTRVDRAKLRLRSLFPGSAQLPPRPYGLWKLSECLYETGLVGPGQGGERSVLLYAHATSRRLSLCSYAREEAQVLLDGTLRRRSKSAEEDKSYPFLFSIVMAVYKVEDYLEEALESVLQQDIGFQKHVQLILVDDGSPDRSGAICDRYARQYPDNIQVIHKENGGVASARNAGKAAAIGKFVNFMDPDDKLAPNALSSVARFYQSHSHDADVVCIPLFFFEAQTGGHWQNYKFEGGKRVINLWRHWNVGAMHTNASFIRLEAVQRYEFDSGLPSGEDTKFLMCVLLEKMALGVVPGTVYWYRRRSSGNSLIDVVQTKRAWYFDYFSRLVFFLLDYSKKKFGYVPEFVQNTLMMDLQWRFKPKAFPPGVLTREEQKRYRATYLRALRQIDDHVIEAQLKLPLSYRIQLYSLKYPNKLSLRYSDTDIHVMVNNHYLRSCSAMHTYFDFIRLKDRRLSVEGTTVMPGILEKPQIEIFLCVAGDFYRCDRKDCVPETDMINCFGRINYQYGFSASIPILPRYYGMPIRLMVRVDGHPVFKHSYNYRKFTPFYGKLNDQYYCRDGLVVKGDPSCLVVSPLTGPVSELEECFLRSLRATMAEEAAKSFGPTLPTDLTPERLEHVAHLRSLALDKHRHRPVWLVSDRPDRAGDNGEALFIYLMAQKNLPADVWFVISKDSPDYQRMAEVGPVVDFGSEQHQELSIVAELLISSQGEDYVFTPYNTEDLFYKDRRYYADVLADQKFVFLQHGIIKDDLSEWLSRYNKNIAGFVTSTQREYQSILDYAYHYSPREIWLTGLPRFDRLYDDRKQQVVLCPTWRLYLRDMNSAQFEQSRYYQFYSALFSDQRLLSALDQQGYRLCLKLHPHMTRFLDYFRRFDRLVLLDNSVPYRQLYAESDLLVTDYSSTAMEFAYQRKSVVYAQFDREEFFAGHTYVPGYFDYEQDGFGPVTSTVEETVDAIIELVKRNCAMAPEYLRRVNDFFPVNDYRNCERVYQKILELRARD